MRVEQHVWTRDGGWTRRGGGRLGDKASLVLVFGDRRELEKGLWAMELRQRLPGGIVVGCSTAGEICGGEVLEGSIVATAVRFDATPVRWARTNIRHVQDATAAGEQLGEGLDPHGLAHVFVLSDGHYVNGSALVAGMASRLPPGIAITGGLAGDGDRFQRTLVALGGSLEEGNVAAVGLYGDRVQVGHGSLGGWDAWGQEHVVTHARGHVLERLDGKPALGLYKAHLGEHAAGLPSSGLLFPLDVRTREGRSQVRTLLSVDEERGTMTMAGDVPVGSRVRLMRANFERLVEGAAGAARMTGAGLGGSQAQLALLVSCVGRRLLLKDRSVEEVEAVRRIVGAQAAVTGFYSYGEISPSAPGASCQLHNQTMTITTLAER